MTSFRSALRSPGAACTAFLCLMVPACTSPGERARIVEKNEVLRRTNEQLQRTITKRDAKVASLTEQIDQLHEFGPDRPANLFSPVKVEIASLSGGVDYNGVPGDDGVTVYVRLRDADGDSMKVPGRLTVQLLDNTDLDAPRVVGVFRFDRPEQLRRAWHGRFGTRHYTLKCPFPRSVILPRSRRLSVYVAFVDFLTGATLTTSKEVTISPRDD